MDVTKKYKFVILFTVFTIQSVCVLAQKTATDLMAELDKASSLKERVDICYSISIFYSSRLKVDSALFFANKIKEISTPSNYKTGFGKYYFATGAALKMRHKTEDAITNLRKAISIFTQEKDHLFLGKSYNTLASLYVLEGKYDLTGENFRLAILNSMIAGDDLTLIKEYLDAGRVFFRSLENDSAIIYFTKGLAIAEKIKHEGNIFLLAGELGILFLDTEDLYKAKYFLEYSLKNCTPTIDRTTLKLQLGHYADCLIKFSEYEKADSILSVIQKINIEFKNDWSDAFLDGLKGNLEFAKYNYRQALTYFVKSRERIISKGMDISFRSIILNYGKTEFMLGNYDNAILYLNEAKKLFHVINSVQFESDVDYFLASCFERKGRSDSALHYFKKYASLKDSAQSLEKQKTVIEVSAKYETEKKEQEIKLLQKESEANALLLRIKNQQIVEQQLEDDKKSQQLILVSQQNEINKLDASQKSLSLENETKENEKSQAKLKLLEQEAAYQKLLAAKQSQLKRNAYILIGAILILGAYIFYRYVRHKKLQNQQEILNERLRISRELHDEIGATLSGVALYSEIAKQKMTQHNEQDAQNYLNHISANSKDMVEKMGDIIWTISPDNDSMERIVARLKSYAVNLCSGKGMQMNFHVDETIKNSFLSMPGRKNIYLFSKEAINNAVKYSAASNVFFSINRNDDWVTVEIKDDGKGFNKDLVEKGNGLNNMQARAEELKADLKIQSKPGSGTCIRLSIGLHPIGGQRRTG